MIQNLVATWTFFLLIYKIFTSFKCFVNYKRFRLAEYFMFNALKFHKKIWFEFSWESRRKNEKIYKKFNLYFYSYGKRVKSAYQSLINSRGWKYFYSKISQESKLLALVVLTAICFVCWIIAKWHRAEWESSYTF